MRWRPSPVWVTLVLSLVLWCAIVSAGWLAVRCVR